MSYWDGITKKEVKSALNFIKTLPNLTKEELIEILKKRIINQTFYFNDTNETNEEAILRMKEFVKRTKKVNNDK